MVEVLSKAKVTGKRQITLPLNVCRDLQLSIGQHIVFAKGADGKIFLAKSPSINEKVIQRVEVALSKHPVVVIECADVEVITSISQHLNYSPLS